MNNIFGFIGNTHHQAFVKKYLQQFSPDIVVETGTLHGWTSRFFADYVPEVHSIEVRVDPHMKARRLLKGISNIEL
jgi:protein-L-isoaspartate O-methyltransferase